MIGYLLGRIAQGVFLLVLVTVLTFSLMHLAPGGPAILMDPHIGAEQAREMERILGLDKPVHIQYLRWAGNLMQGDWGKSFTMAQPVLEIVLGRLPATMVLAVASIVIAIVLGVFLGAMSAIKKDTVFDSVITIVSFSGISIPTFWFGLMLILLFSVYLRVLPSSGMLTVGAGFSLVDFLAHLAMPAVVLGSVNMAQIARYTRSSVLSVLQEDYVRTARAKGLAYHRVLFKHVLRNALLPIITLIGMLIPRVASGAAIAETVFAWPGLGRLAVSAAFQRDYPVIMAVTLLVSFVVIVSTLITDMLYTVVDPRIKLEKHR
jgi:peptide/nickel transport system permease protein